MKAQLVAWLNGSRDFKTGIALLKATGRTGIPYHDTPTARSKVFNAIRDLVRPAQPATDSKPVLPEAVATEKARDTYTGSVAPGHPIAIEAKRTADLQFKEMQHKRAQLFALCPKEANTFENEGAQVAQRGELALEVIRMQDKVNEAYDAVRFAEEHGRLPEKETAPASHPPEDLPRLISNLKKNIYRIRKKPGHDPADLASKETQLENLQNQLEHALG